ncbi:MAG: hypothetical protein A2161_11810 [Candidatus Schekmanbacteria bacterium RBG_13_48_7]|uniref:DUF445 domain-containing protein n=1 Tax=Candidatus Schekmanbacteria bacterium RBG_13_48_7 TaxID=1817878 RepID=A0A1F7RLQ2_9BACT|nr:MAG: hypothetical protein A2161_11810 [Candidatus Schekmanbacteria bacterium RBG_13_48_7]
MNNNNFIGFSIGSLCVFVVAVLFVISFLISLYHPSFSTLSAILLGGFIGGFTNSVAIRMLFEKYWYLPGSGVLLKRRNEIILSLAETVETHIINTQTLEQKLHEAVQKVNTDNVKNSMNAIIEEFKDDLLEYLNKQETHKKIVTLMKQNLGLGGKIINATGIKDFDVLAHEILDNLDDRVENFKITDEMINTTINKFGTLEEFVFKPNNQFLVKHYKLDESLAFVLLNKLNIKKIVVERLSLYPPEKIRDIIEKNTKEHLSWLEVFGVILGIVFTTVFVLIQ